jgi:hypothetical protein
VTVVGYEVCSGDFLKWGWFLEVSAAVESFLSFSFKELLVNMIGHY